MRTDMVELKGTDLGVTEALEESERFCDYAGVSGKAAIHVRLLTEEALGMVRGILGEQSAQFWLESVHREGKRLCRICISVNTTVDYDRRETLLGVSSTGKNAAAVGVVGKIREMIEIGIQAFDDASRFQTQSCLYGTDFIAMGLMDLNDTTEDFCWSLDNYKEQVSEAPESGEAWDELEKSVVSRLADEVRVGIRSGRVDLVVEKQI